jgi:hypothetical protein
VEYFTLDVKKQSINQSYLLVNYCFLRYIYCNTLKFLQAVCQSIKSNIEQGDVGAYLLEHIDLDLTSIQKVLGKNKDDVLILIHVLLTQIMNRHTMAVIGKHQIIIYTNKQNCICCVIVSMLISNGSIGWVTPKTIKLVGIRCFSAEHAALRSKSKDWLARYQDNLSELSNISTNCWFSPSILFSSTNKSDHHGIP